MPVNYNFKKGVDIPNWQWLSPFPGGGGNYQGTACTYDGKRYIYWAVQTGSNSATAAAASLWRYDTFSNGWQYLTNLNNSNAGVDIEYDNTRNVLYITNGGGATSIQIFNLNTTSVTVMNVSVGAWALATGIALPLAANTGASLSMPDDSVVPSPIDTGTADATGNTTTVVKATNATGTFALGMVGLQLRVTSGTQSGQRRTISAVTDKNTLTLSSALPGALTSGDTFAVELQDGTATAASTTTLTNGNAAWTTNQYANHDVIITAGTGAGQRRRIASNTATVLTLAGSTTGNARTGAFATSPDTTSTYRIVPSADFLYYQPGNGSSALYRIDVAQTTSAAWSASLTASPGAIGGGGNTFYPGSGAPGYIIALRGSSTKDIYLYNIGTNAWTSFNVYAGAETFNTGAASAMLHGKRKMFIQKEGQPRTYTYDFLTGFVEPGPFMPYAAPQAIDGKRAKFVRTVDGVEWLYVLRASGQEFFRVPCEWL